MPDIREIFLENKAWVQEKLNMDPHYFENHSIGQSPKYLWIGCSDSRILPNEITGTSVGDLFVHRNIANVVRADDINLFSVVYYAVKYLKIKDIIVCGHYGCGGVAAAMSPTSFGYLDNWLEDVRKVYKAQEEELATILDSVQRTDRLVELNVLAQVQSLSSTPLMRDLLQEFTEIRIHSWVYDMRTGRIKDLK